MIVDIYGLYDPDTDELRYIGKANNSAKRLKTHILERSMNRPVNRWVRSLVENGKVPRLVVLEQVPIDRWEEAERAAISKYRATCKLLNLADGGAVPSQTKDQRRNAARASNAAQSKKPDSWKRFVSAKQDLARMLANAMRKKDYSFAARLRFIMRLHYARSPKLHATWATL